MRIRISALSFIASLVALILSGYATDALAASGGTVQFASASYSVTETAASVTVAVTRTGGSSGQTWVNYGTVPGTATFNTNYDHKSGTLYWPNGDTSSKTLTITLVQQAGFSGTKSFAVQMSSPTNATLGSPSSTTISLVAPTTTSTLALASSTDTVASTSSSVTLSVKRTGSNAVTVHYATVSGTAVSGTNFTNTSGTLNWASGNTSAQKISVAIANVSSTTATKTFTLNLSSPSGAVLSSPASATVTITYANATGSGVAAKLAAKLGKPSRMLVGISSNEQVTAQQQGLKVDIADAYLVGDWTSWNSPPCDYVCVVAAKADSLGAVPMYTLYKMADWGDGNLAAIADAGFMAAYWADLKLMYQDIAAYDRPALVNLEPDFWGYVERQAPNSDPAQMAAVVSANADCTTEANNVTGLAACIVKMARKYAPKAYLGFQLSAWGGNTTAEVVTFMNAVGAQNADFITEQTLDRDPGCFELSPQPAYCSRSGSGWYLDATNQTHPTFNDYFAGVQAHHAGIGGLPVIFWQTPMGVPSTTTGGTDFHYRSNYENYFLSNPADLTAVGGLGVVFSAGESHQTGLTTDGGQFQRLSGAYLAAPVKLP